MNMLKVSAAEFQRDIGRYQDIALRQPVAVTIKGRESCILLSMDEYRRLMQRDRRAFRTEDLTDDEVAHREVRDAPWSRAPRR